MFYIKLMKLLKKNVALIKGDKMYVSTNDLDAIAHDIIHGLGRMFYVLGVDKDRALDAINKCIDDEYRLGEEDDESNE